MQLLRVLLSVLVLVVLVCSKETGACSESQRCETGCCSKSGYCGFGPDYCGDDVCISDCNAVAECGPYAAVANATCPLNVCCSEYGFCGTTAEFCGEGCQSNCNAITPPEQYYVGYYESWSYQHPCDVVLPSEINTKPWTHLYYCFAGIHEETATISRTHERAGALMKELTSLRFKNPDLKIYISIGGWAVGGEPFSNMVRFPGTRSSFIHSIMHTVSSFGFQGIDIDWEYPAAKDRGGREEDTKNFVTFMKELKESCGDQYGLTLTLPSSYWYLRGFDVIGLSKYVDHFNFMSYDIHGTWDGNSEYTSAVVNPHTNLTEISDGLDLLWRNGIDPARVMLGLAFYGRSFTLNDTSCTQPGCPFGESAFRNGGARPGQCTETSGILSDYEINDIIERYDPTIQYDKTAAVNWMTWNSDQWVSFDNARTLKQKAEFANSRCIGGLFSWAVDLGGPGTLKNPNDLSLSSTSMDGASVDGGADGTGDLYVNQSVVEGDSWVSGISPVNVIFPPLMLPSPTIVEPEPLVTPIEVAWTTTVTLGVSSTPTVTSTVHRTIETTTFEMPRVTLPTIPWWNWNMTQPGITKTSTQLFPSITFDPITFQDNLTRYNLTIVPTYSRTLFPPPWPWSTTSMSPSVPTGPTVTFIQGPPGPTCTSECGTKCEHFCVAPCLINCEDPLADVSWIDPADPDPPSHNHCAGPDCDQGKCEGDLCAEIGCDGPDCINDTVCIGPECHETGCIGSGCEPGGTCVSEPCLTVGCLGPDCNSNIELCLGPGCISLGCIGPSCNKNSGICSGINCHKVTCSGPHCQNGVCTGDGCQPADPGCEPVEADLCTEFVSSSLVTPASTSTTETSTHCETVTACEAQPTTATTTISEASTGVTPYMYFAWSTGYPEDTAASISSELASLWRTTPTPTTTTTSSSSTSSTSSTSTTSLPFTPAEASHSCTGMSAMCGIFLNLRAFCDVAKSNLVGDMIYGTTHKDDRTGTCYSDNRHAGMGCGVFVSGDNCRLRGSTMAAAYDHIMNPDLGGCEICGSATFVNGCSLRVDYVTGCHRSH